jgi:alpha-glucosidase (family GH31 glycosyl hydrolase)
MIRLRHVASLSALALAVVSCGGDEPAEEPTHSATPAPTTTATMDASTDVSMDAASDGDAATDASMATSASLVGKNAIVTLTFSPTFHLLVTKPDGTPVLDSLDASPNLATDPAGAYGPIGATHRAVQEKPSIVEGWDHQAATESTWLHAGVVTHADVTATTASIDLADSPGGMFTLHLDVSISDDEVTLDAKVTGSPTIPANDMEDVSPPGLNEMDLSFHLPADEHFYGLGERYVTTDHRGASYYGWTEEGGIGNGESVPPGPHNPGPNGPSMTHAPMPYFLSSRGYGLWLETTYRHGFDLGNTDPSVWKLSTTETHLRLHAYVHDDPRDVLSVYTAKAGRPALPAPWVFGPRRRVDRNNMVNGVPEEQALRDQGVPTTMVDDTTHFLPIGSQVGIEDTLSAWTTHLHSLGFRAIAYFNAYVSVTDPRAADLAAQGKANGYFVKQTDGTEFDTLIVSAGPQTVATIDMTNPDAVTWYQGILQKGFDLGYDGWMLDFGEYLPVSAVMADGSSGWQEHNKFPIDYQKATFDYATKVRGNDFMFFARAGGTGTAGLAPVVWSGDPSASFDPVKGLPANVRAGLSISVSGVSFWGSDISGYTCLHADTDPPNEELYLRWAEFGALSTDMHDENACAQLPPNTPTKWTLWQSPHTTQVYGSYASLHTRLFPYTYAAALEATKTGFPVMRHPILLYPTDPGAQAVDTEYFFGPSLYVAPVVHRGDTSRTLWLPPGAWVDYVTNEPHVGGQSITVDAPIDTLPLFLRAGGLVPLLDPAVQTLADDMSDSVVSMSDRAGIYDIRGALSTTAPMASITLVDGTTMQAILGAGDPAIPDGFTTAATDADLSTCDACAKLDTLAGGVTRLRVSTTTNGAVTAGSVTLTTSGTVSRARWDLALLSGM